MVRPALEVADIFRGHAAAWRDANRGHVSLDQLKVMSAIESCRTAALGGHVARCDDCAHTVIAYNSCRNRHCPKCQGAAAREWMAAREAELLPLAYFHVVFTLPSEIGDIAYQNKAVIYDLLFKASAETLLTIAADPKHLGARIGFISVLHTWGSAMTHHPHIHMIVPGGGLSPDGSKWIACRPRYFLTVEVLSALFRRLFLQMLVAAHHAGRLQFFGDHARLADKAAFKAYLAPLRKINWVVYAKEPFAGPRQVLRYLSRYTHRIAISNRRLVSADENGVTFKYKDYRIEGPARYKTRSNETWAMNFVHDQLATGSKLRVLTILDIFSRFSPALEPRFNFSGADVVRVLEGVCKEVGFPATIRVDQGSEFVSRDLDLWAYQRGVTLDFSRPGNPTDNAFIESFNGKFRAECLNAHWFMSLDDAQRKCEAWRRDYNEERPHSAIGNKARVELIDRSVAHGPP